MNVLSLFSGIGGLDLGLERAGMTICGQVEIDPWCRKVLAAHWPEVPRHDDVRTCVQWWGDRPAPDLVAGGFPCQPVSLAGKGLAQDDERWLWPAFAGVVRQLRPAFVFVENVPGLLGRGMGDVLGDLAACGYDAEWDCIPAAALGAPHIRDRVFIVAYPDGSGTRADTRRSSAAPPARAADGPQRRRQPRSDFGSGSQSLADTAGSRQPSGEPRQGRQIRHQARRTQPERRSIHVAHSSSPGFDPRSRLGWTRQAPQRSGWWAVEPGVGRVAHGIPARVDRLRGLGNAVVPQVAEHIGRLIMGAAA